MGGKEFFHPDFCYPVAQGDIISFVRTVEHVLDIARETPQLLRGQGKRAADFVAERYSLQREESDIVSFWREMFAHG
jgi:hypothetical protein